MSTKDSPEWKVRAETHRMAHELVNRRAKMARKGDCFRTVIGMDDGLRFVSMPWDRLFTASLVELEEVFYAAMRREPDASLEVVRRALCRACSLELINHPLAGGAEHTCSKAKAGT